MSKMTREEALQNALWYAATRTWRISEDDKQYIDALRKEAGVA